MELWEGKGFRLILAAWCYSGITGVPLLYKGTPLVMNYVTLKDTEHSSKKLDNVRTVT